MDRIPVRFRKTEEFAAYRAALSAAEKNEEWNKVHESLKEKREALRILCDACSENTAEKKALVRQVYEIYNVYLRFPESRALNDAEASLRKRMAENGSIPLCTGDCAKCHQCH